MYTLLVGGSCCLPLLLLHFRPKRDYDDDDNDDDNYNDYHGLNIDCWRSVLTTTTVVPRGSSGACICFVSFGVEQWITTTDTCDRPTTDDRLPGPVDPSESSVRGAPPHNQSSESTLEHSGGNILLDGWLPTTEKLFGDPTN